MNKEGLLLNFMLIYLMVNKHNKEILRNFKSKSDFPDATVSNDTPLEYTSTAILKASFKTQFTATCSVSSMRSGPIHITKPSTITTIENGPSQECKQSFFPLYIYLIFILGSFFSHKLRLHDLEVILD